MTYTSIDIANLNHSSSFLASSLEPFEKDRLIIDRASTAHYGSSLVEFLLSRHCTMCAINPIQTSTMRKNNIRRKKTDTLDTITAARTFMVQKLMSLRIRTKIQLVSCIEQASPEPQYFFKGVYHKSVYAPSKNTLSSDSDRTVNMTRLVHLHIYSNSPDY